MVLVYIKLNHENTDGTYDYNFYFSDTPEIVWGFDWEVNNPASCEDLTPDRTTISKVYKVRTDKKLKTIEDTTCYSMEYAINGIVALGWIDLEGLEEYPEFGRMVFHFGDSVDKVNELLGNYNFEMKEY